MNRPLAFRSDGRRQGTPYGEKWHVVRVGGFGAGYDGLHIHIEEESLFSLLINAAVEGVVFRLNPLVDKFAGLWENEDDRGTFAYSFVNAPFQMLWRIRNRVQGRRQWIYPIIDQWARGCAADLYDDWMIDVERLKDHGTTCPECGIGRVNPWNTEPLARGESCLHCQIRKGTYGGDP